MKKKKQEAIEADVMGVVEEVTPVSEMEITSNDDYLFAAQYLGSITGARKRVQAFFKPMKQAADKAKRSILDEEKKLLKPLEEVERSLRTRVSDFQNRQREEREALERAAREQLGGDLPVIVDHTPTPKVEGVTMKESWDFEIVDVTKLKSDFLLPDMQRIRKAVQLYKADAEKFVGEGSIKSLRRDIAVVRRVD